MTIHEFMMEGKNAVAAGLRRRGNHDIIVQETEFIKANDELCCGLNLREKGSLVGRTVYLNDLYDRYSAGESLDPLMRELEERCVQSLAVEPPAAALSIETAFKNYKERLSLRPLSIEQNRVFIEDKPFINAGNGLVLVAVINSERDIMSEWKITVTDRLLDDLGSDSETLLTDALRNTMEMEPAVFMRLQDVVLSRMYNGPEPENYFDGNSDACTPDAVHILSNESMFLGATALFYPGTMQNIADLFGCGYSVIPSSVHELMIIPDAMDVDPEGMKIMLREGNSKADDINDILAYDVYHYDPDTYQLDIVA